MSEAHLELRSLASKARNSPYSRRSQVASAGAALAAAVALWVAAVVATVAAAAAAQRQPPYCSGGETRPQHPRLPSLGKHKPQTLVYRGGNALCSPYKRNPISYRLPCPL